MLNADGILFVKEAARFVSVDVMSCGRICTLVANYILTKEPLNCEAFTSSQWGSCRAVATECSLQLFTWLSDFNYVFKCVERS